MLKGVQDCQGSDAVKYSGRSVRETLLKKTPRNGQVHTLSERDFVDYYQGFI